MAIRLSATVLNLWDTDECIEIWGSVSLFVERGLTRMKNINLWTYSVLLCYSFTSIMTKNMKLFLSVFNMPTNYNWIITRQRTSNCTNISEKKKGKKKKYYSICLHNNPSITDFHICSNHFIRRWSPCCQWAWHFQTMQQHKKQQDS